MHGIVRWIFVLSVLNFVETNPDNGCPPGQKLSAVWEKDGNVSLKCFNPLVYIACPGGSLKFVGYGNPLKYACDECGLYAEKKQICCGGRLYNKTRNVAACCGGKLWDQSIHLCCKDELTNKRYPGNEEVYEECCGTQTYDSWSYTEDCCYDREVFNPNTENCASNGMVVGSHQYVCGTNIYELETSTCCKGKLYNTNPSDENLCCGDELYAEVTDGFQCCGTDLYHGSHDLCCGNEVHSLAASTSTCCGTDSIARNDTNSICCGDKKYEAIHGQYTGCCVRQDDYNEPSFVGIYNTREQTCCRGELIDHHDATKFCCDGGVASRQDLSQTRCCNTGSEIQMYDPNEYVCHENLVVHKELMCGNDLRTFGHICCNDVRFENFSPDGNQLQCCGAQSMDPQKYECLMDSIVPKHCPRLDVTEQEVLNEICTFVNGTVIYAKVKKQDDEFVRVRRRYSYSSEHIRKRTLQLGVNAACNSDIFAKGSKLIVLTSSKYDKKNNNLKLKSHDIVLTWNRNYSKTLRRKLKAARTFCSLT